MPIRRRCSAASNWSKATRRSAIGVRARLCRKPGRRLDRDRGLSRPLRRRAAPAGGERDARRERGADPLSALHVADRPAGRRDACCARWQPRIRRFRAGADRPARRASAGSTTSMARAERVFDALRQRRETLREADRPLVDQLLALRATLPDRLECAACRPTSTALNIRHHGDFHLGQMLIVKDDIFIIDFEGEPRRAAGRAAAQGAGGARRRRPDPLDRLFGYRRARARAQSGARRARQACALRSANGATAPTATFLAAYREAMTDRRLWPADPQRGRRPAEFLPA